MTSSGFEPASVGSGPPVGHPRNQRTRAFLRVVLNLRSGSALDGILPPNLCPLAGRVGKAGFVKGVMWWSSPATYVSFTSETACAVHWEASCAWYEL